MPQDHSKEIDLIVECCRTSLDVDQKERISTLLGNKPDWEYILNISGRNAVISLVARNLLTSFGSLLPKRVSARLAKSYRENLNRNMFLTGRLLEIVRHFDANELPVLPFKGPLLAATAYGDISYRNYVDLDILVEPKKVGRAIELLKGLNYTPFPNQRIPGLFSIFSTKKKDIYLRSDDGKVNVELHWKLSGSHFAFPFVTNEFWSGLETVELAGHAVKSLAFDELLVYLCMHGSRHGWEKFGWICDVRELIGSAANIDWFRVIQKARSMRCERSLYLGLHLVHEFFHENFAIANWESVKNDASFRTYTKQIREQLFEESSNLMKPRDRYLYHLAVREGRLDKQRLRYYYFISYLQDVFAPTEADIRSVRLPEAFAPLYYITRPIRLAFRFIVGRASDQK